MPVKDLILGVALRIGTDKQAAQQGVAALRGMADALKALQKQADDTRAKLVTATKIGKIEGLNDLSKSLSVIVKSGDATNLAGVATQLKAISAASDVESLKTLSGQIASIASSGNLSGLKEVSAQLGKLVKSGTEEGATAITTSLEMIEAQLTDFGQVVGQGIDTAYQKADRALYKVERLGMNLYQAAGAMADIGRAFSFEDQLRQFEQVADVTDKVAKRNAELNKSMGESQARVGRVVAEAWTPILERTDALQKNVAGFLERNPALLKAAVNIGATVSTLANLAQSLGQGLRIYADIKQVQISTTQLLAAQIMEKAAAKQLQAAGLEMAAAKTEGAGGAAKGLLGGVKGIAGKAIGLAGAVGAGIAVGTTVYDATIGQSQGTTSGAILGKAAALFSRAVKTLTEGEAAGTQAFLDTAKMYGVTADAAQDTTESLGSLTDVLKEQRDATQKAQQAYDDWKRIPADWQRQLDEIGFAGDRSVAGLLKAAGAWDGVAAAALKAGTDATKAQGMASGLRRAARVATADDPAVKAYADWRKEQGKADAQYTKDRTQVEVQGAEARAKALVDFQKQANDDLESLYQQQAKEREDLVRSQGQAVLDLEKERTRELADFNKQEARTDADARKQRARDIAAFQKDEAKAGGGLGDEQAKALADFLKQEAATRKEWERQRGKDLVEFARGEAETEHDYYAQRLKDAEGFARDDAQQQVEHEKQMLRMNEDYQDSLQGLAEDRDAFGVIRAMRAHEKERSRAEQDYTDQVKQRDAQRAQQLSDQEADFQASREKRLADFERRRAEDEAEQKYQADLRRQQFDEQQAEQRAQAAQEKADRWKELQERFAQEDADRAEQKAQRRADFDEQRAERLADFAVAQQDERDKFTESQKLAREAFVQQQADKLAQIQEEQAQSRGEQAQRLFDLAAQYGEERKQREADFVERVNDIDATLTGEREKRLDYYAQMADDMDAYLGRLRDKNAEAIGLAEERDDALAASAQSAIEKVAGNLSSGMTDYLSGITGFFSNAAKAIPGSAGTGAVQANVYPGALGTGATIAPSSLYRVGMAAGGYARGGLIVAGEKGREFVLSHDTTRVVERSIGAPLTQRLVAERLTVPRMAAGGYIGEPSSIPSMGASTPQAAALSLNQNFTFNGSQTDGEKAWYKQVAYDQALTAFDDVLNRRR